MQQLSLLLSCRVLLGKCSNISGHKRSWVVHECGLCSLLNCVAHVVGLQNRHNVAENGAGLGTMLVGSHALLWQTVGPFESCRRLKQ